MTELDHKGSVRARVWSELRRVALPDSRFDFDFAEFIADFEGGGAACARLAAHEAYQNADLIFITPDNCLERLRHRALLDGKRVLVTTYSIRRGFWLLDPAEIAPEFYLYAATLDGMERVGRPVDLKAIAAMPPVDYLVTGTGAINREGVRFGKGHGFFDVEWGMLYRLGRVGSETPVAAVVHDCQVLDERLVPEIFDTTADFIFTPTETISVTNAQKPDCGIVWDLLDPRMFATIPPLQELRAMQL